MLAEPPTIQGPTNRVVVALQNGFYGASSGSGFSNRAFLTVLTKLVSPGRLVVMPVHHDPTSDDPLWTAQLVRTLRQADAKILPIRPKSSAHHRDERCSRIAEQTARIASRVDRCLLIGLDRSLLGLGRFVFSNVDLLLVPRSTTAVMCPSDGHRIVWERESVHAATDQGGRIAAISAFMREHLQRDYGVPNDVMVDMPNGLLLDGEPALGTITSLPAPAEEGFLFALGRPVASKGFEDLLAALEILRARRFQLPHLLLAATACGAVTPYQRLLAKRIAATQLNATLITRFSPGVRDWMRSPALRALVVPSRQEPFGRIPLEAFALHAGPVVATRAGGLCETVIDGQTGFTAEPHDPSSLADAIHRALTITASERARLAQAGTSLLHERHDYLATIHATLTNVAPWAVASRTEGAVQ